MVDETTDIVNIEQVVVYLRWVGAGSQHGHFKVHEDLFVFIK